MSKIDERGLSERRSSAAFTEPLFKCCEVAIGIQNRQIEFWLESILDRHNLLDRRPICVAIREQYANLEYSLWGLIVFQSPFSRSLHFEEASFISGLRKKILLRKTAHLKILK